MPFQKGVFYDRKSQSHLRNNCTPDELTLPPWYGCIILAIGNYWATGSIRMARNCNVVFSCCHGICARFHLVFIAQSAENHSSISAGKARLDNRGDPSSCLKAFSEIMAASLFRFPSTLLTTPAKEHPFPYLKYIEKKFKKHTKYSWVAERPGVFSSEDNGHRILSDAYKSTTKSVLCLAIFSLREDRI